MNLQQKTLTLAVMLALSSMAAMAQEQKVAEEQKIAEALQNESEALPEVSVKQNRIRAGNPQDAAHTGSKTDTPLRDVPASVAVVPVETLREQGVQTMNEAMRNVSSVQPQHGGGYGYANNYNSRGLAVNFLRDDLPDGTAQNGYFRTMYDVERIEVLKGPGSALFGSGGPGGSINVVTKKPQAEYGLEVGTTFGSFNTRDAYMDLTGTITQGVTGRLIVDTEKTDGIRGLGREITEFSPSVAFNYADDKTLLIDVDVRDIKVKPDNYGILFDGKANIANVSDKTRYYTPFDYSEQHINRITATHDWAINNALSMRTVFSNDTRDLDFIRNAGGDGGNATGLIKNRNLRQQSDDARYTTFQNELTWKVDTGSVKHTVLAGYEYKNTKNDTLRQGYTLANITNILNPVVPEVSLASLAKLAIQSFNRELTSDTNSVYVQDQLAFGEKIKVRVGLRNDHVNYQDKGVSTVNNVANVARVVDETKDLTTGSLGAVFQPTANLAFYTGFSNGKFINMATEGNILVDVPESSEQFEIGTKSSFLQGKIDLNVALFDTKRENYIITLPGASVGTPDGKDKSKGVELDVGVHPIAGLNVNANAVFMDAETKSTTLAKNDALGVPLTSIYGTRPTAVSEQIFNIFASYEIQTGDVKGLKFGIGATHKGDSYADNLNLYKIPAYTVYDAAISYAQPKWQAALNLKNITDKTYYTSPTFAGALPGDPRSIFATLRFDFK
ncbi:TonB-dependent receptor [Methylotenera sp.]|uniref:TonB-dependent receptor n=1 Tax=Methylotenera sp. TaxID=2051956 RepID=UPI002487E943|nr:TonB-dependent receptor [Methylotenera sp.]MDI1363229.1 TonB-dependent receptor [Methylotenera sp.]